jgi:putative photosynthetic complex assembly protein
VSEIDKEKFPTIALYAAGAIMVVAIAAAAWSRYQASQAPEVSVEMQEPVKGYVDLVFVDQADGSVQISNAATSQVVHTIAPGEDAFIRAVIRGYGRDRKSRNIKPDAPFRLYQLVDTRLVLEDTSTKRRVNLRAFGPTQQAAFSRLLTPDSAQK